MRERDFVRAFGLSVAPYVALVVRTERIPEGRVGDLMAFALGKFEPLGVDRKHVFTVQEPTEGTLQPVLELVRFWSTLREELRGRACRALILRGEALRRALVTPWNERLPTLHRLDDAQEALQHFELGAKTAGDALEARTQEMALDVCRDVGVAWNACLQQLWDKPAMGEDEVRRTLDVFARTHVLPKVAKQLEDRVKDLANNLPSVRQQLQEGYAHAHVPSLIALTAPPSTRSPSPTGLGKAAKSGAAGAASALLAVWARTGVVPALAMGAVVVGAVYGFAAQRERQRREPNAAASGPDTLEKELHELCVAAVKATHEEFDKGVARKVGELHEAVATARSAAEERGCRECPRTSAARH
jgi:hypothetical protein